MNWLKLTYDGIVLGLVVRGTIAKLYTYRVRAGRQEKFAYTVPGDPQTPAQLARRALFAAGVALWHQLSPQEKQDWQKGGPRSGINWFMRDYLKSY